MFDLYHHDFNHYCFYFQLFRQDLKFRRLTMKDMTSISRAVGSRPKGEATGNITEVEAAKDPIPGVKRNAGEVKAAAHRLKSTD